MKEAPYEEELLILSVQECLAQALLESGLTQSALAQRVGVSAPAISMALRAGCNMSLERIARLLHAAGFRIVPTLERLK